MNYVILNGVKSNTVKGLLIQSLPPISKPLMRSQVEEIDGRDGDIVTKLGYSAYDKEMSIGLYGDYDVDDVIQFFDSEGTVTFSNEPDKYYNYQILEQIDFERLIRFKTATVVFHVQPFKYAAVDQEFTLNNQFIDVQSYSSTQNGITLEVENGAISVSGTGTAATEFYVPIESIDLGAGDYTLYAESSGTNASSASIRLIGTTPSNADSLGGNYLTLQDDDTVTLDGTLTASKTFGYVWFYITAGTALDFTVNVTLQNNDLDSLSLINRGNTVSKPKITIYGSGTINLSLNGQQIFVISLGDMGFITIDAAQMNAYQGDPSELLMNRYVVGDYDNLALNIGTNTISWTGDVQEVIVEDFSRWI